MALGIYKPGQGYWVRVMTATIIGIFTVALAAWAWHQTAVFTERLPSSQWSMKIEKFVDATGHVVEGAALNPGEAVTLLGEAGESGMVPTIGQASIAAYDPDERLATIGSVQMDGQSEPSATLQIRAGDAAAPRLVARVQAQSVSGLPPVEPVLVKGIVAAVILLAGTILAWYYTASRVKTVEFLIATDFEMKKVNWSTPREVVGSTWVVVCACVFLALLLFTFDLLMGQFFALIRVMNVG